MIGVVQRVTRGEVRVEAKSYSAGIGPGLVVLLGVVSGDEERDSLWMAKKCAHLRIFSDDDGKMNRSVLDVGGDILAISQFTLAGDARKGNRPSFVKAAEPMVAKRLYELVVEELGRYEVVGGGGLVVRQGLFQEHMEVELVNDGPVTIILDSRSR